MKVVVPVNDFHFESTAASSHVSAPSSPKRIGRGGDPFDYNYHYTSTPTSPNRVAAIFASSAVPFVWEQKPGTPRSPKSDVADDFAFDFSGQLEKGVPPPDLSTADELFEEGKIRPLKLKPPTRLHNLSLDDDKTSVASSPRSPKSPNRGLWSPRARGKVGSDEGTAAAVEATRERGRERGPTSPLQASSISSSRSRKGSRSLSPMRTGVGGFFAKSSDSSTSPKASTSAFTSTIASECLKTTCGGGSSRKWRLRDLLLFRSASEGRATGNKSKDDPLRKYAVLSSPNPSSSLFSPKKVEDSRNSSFRSTDSGTSTSSIRRSTDRSMRRAGSGVSAHEMHYMSNRAASEEMKKKTALPFNRQGLFGCLRFNPAVHSIARGFNSSYSFGRRQ